MTLEGEI
jgi:hypothetical protein